MLKYDEEYVEQGHRAYEEHYRQLRKPGAHASL